MEPEMDLRPLDAGQGPARRISTARTVALVDGALGAAFAPAAPVRKVPRWAAAAAVVLLAGGGVAAAMLLRDGPSAPRPAAPRQQPREITPETPPVQVVAPPRIEPTAEPEAAAATVREAPEDLLAIANRLRGERNWRAAERTYQRVIQSFPGSREAYAARVAAGDLRLHHLGDPRGALRLFRSASRGQGALSEEAAWGVVEAHRSLGDANAEGRALRSFLASFPQSLHRTRAQARLTTIEGAP